MFDQRIVTFANLPAVEKNFRMAIEPLKTEEGFMTGARRCLKTAPISYRMVFQFLDCGHIHAVERLVQLSGRLQVEFEISWYGRGKQLQSALFRIGERADGDRLPGNDRRPGAIQVKGGMQRKFHKWKHKAGGAVL